MVRVFLKMSRPCFSGCGRYLSSSDGHECCFVCLGFEHAKAALVDDSCSFCGNMTFATLRSRLNDLKVRVPVSTTRSAPSNRASSSAGGPGDLRVTVWNKAPTTLFEMPLKWHSLPSVAIKGAKTAFGISPKKLLLKYVFRQCQSAS